MNKLNKEYKELQERNAINTDFKRLKEYKYKCIIKNEGYYGDVLLEREFKAFDFEDAETEVEGFIEYELKREPEDLYITYYQYKNNKWELLDEEEERDRIKLKEGFSGKRVQEINTIEDINGAITGIEITFEDNETITIDAFNNEELRFSLIPF